MSDIIEAELDLFSSATKETKSLTLQLSGLAKAAKSVGEAMTKAFDLSDAVDSVTRTRTAGADLDKQLLVLRLSLGKLKSALNEAAAPMAEAVLPVIQQGVYSAIRLAKQVALVTRALFGGTAQAEEMADAQENLSRSTGKAARSLASFDRLERLNKSTASVTETVTSAKVKDTLTPQLQAVVDKIRALMAKIAQLLAPLKAMDFSAAATSLQRLRQAVAPLTATVFAGLEWAWYNLLVPLARWTVEDALPAFLDMLSAGLVALEQAVQAIKPAAAWLWTEFLQPLGRWAGQQVVSSLEEITMKLRDFGAWMEENGHLIPEYLGKLENLLHFLSGGFLTGWKDAWQRASDAAASIWTGLGEVLKTPVNGIIGFLNSFLIGVTAGINTLIRGINALRFTVPDWVPALGGQSLGFDIATMKTPQIPYLAQGAVLPPNRPFLAVVGDQRRGTNIEAPLATIQEAVAAVMGDQIAAMMTGFEALLEENRQLRQVVQTIQVGDTVIGQAALRYNRRCNTAKGGV